MGGLLLYTDRGFSSRILESVTHVFQSFSFFRGLGRLGPGRNRRNIGAAAKAARLLINFNAQPHRCHSVRSGLGHGFP